MQALFIIAQFILGMLVFPWCIVVLFNQMNGLPSNLAVVWRNFQDWGLNGLIFIGFLAGCLAHVLTSGPLLVISFFGRGMDSLVLWMFLVQPVVQLILSRIVRSSEDMRFGVKTSGQVVMWVDFFLVILFIVAIMMVYAAGGT